MASTWETLEERERRVRGTRTTSAMARAAEQIPVPTTLKAAFAERPFISREDLRNIARQHYERPVITFYLNLAPQLGGRADPPVFVSIFLRTCRLVTTTLKRGRLRPVARRVEPPSSSSSSPETD